MKTNGISRLGILGAVVVLLITALAVGIGIKLSQPHRVEVEPQVEKQQTKPAETRPQEEGNRSEMTQEDEEFLLWLDEEIKTLEDQEKQEAMVVEEEAEDMPEAEPIEHEAQEERGFGGRREVRADLNLTEEEQAK